MSVLFEASGFKYYYVYRKVRRAFLCSDDN